MKNFTAAVLLYLLITELTVISTVNAQPSKQPLIQKSNLAYLGGFALPKGQYGNSNFSYAGHGVAPYNDPVSGKKTLFMEGHAWYPGNVAQVEIPSVLSKSDIWSDLPVAKVLQDFYDITDGKLGTLNNGIGGNNFIYGMLSYNGRLIVGASNAYDAGNNQDKSHGASGFKLSDTNDFKGFIAINAEATPRALGGYMTTIPAEWQPLFGGPALTGNCCLSIISNTSSGPAATVFDPDSIGKSDPIDGKTILYYPLDHPLDTFNAQTGSNVKGMAFPGGSRSVLFFGRISNLTYCYGPGTTDSGLAFKPAEGGTWCYDPCNSSKGGHGYPYYHLVLAYDAGELLKVKNGTKQSWEVEPYGRWILDEMDNSGCAGITSAGFDPSTNKLYFAADFGEEPRIYVYQITVPENGITKYTLTVTNGAGSGNYAAGTVVAITANNPVAGKIFDKWSGNTSGIANINSSGTSIIMPAANTSISAAYKNVLGFTGYSVNNTEVYPNPFKDHITICMPGEASIFDINGALKLRQWLPDEVSQLDLGNLEPGIYLVEIKNENEIKTFKIVKE